MRHIVDQPGVLLWVLAANLYGISACTAQENQTGSMNGKTATEIATIKPDDTIKVEAVFAATECGTAAAKEGVQRIENQAQLDQLYQQFYANIISELPPKAPMTDFTQSALIFVSMGMKNTGGYRVHLAAREASIRGETAIVSLQWNSPPADAFTTQVLTNPCLLFKMPLGHYRQIQIIDQQGTQRGSVIIQ